MVANCSLREKPLMRRGTVAGREPLMVAPSQVGINAPDVDAVNTASFSAALFARAPFVRGRCRTLVAGFWTPFHIVRFPSANRNGQEQPMGQQPYTRNYRGILADSRDLALSNRSTRLTTLRFASSLQTRFEDVMHPLATLMPYAIKAVQPDCRQRHAKLAMNVAVPPSVLPLRSCRGSRPGRSPVTDRENARSDIDDRTWTRWRGFLLSAKHHDERHASGPRRQ